jgi:hypothetical protein
MKIQVKTMQGKIHPVEIKDDATVQELKVRVFFCYDICL